MTREAFLQAILNAPEDDSLRLVFADFLEERDDPRGSFIRAQCELARLAHDDPRRPEFEAEERRLLEAYQDAWLGPLREHALAWTFRRGFVEEVTVSVPTYLERAAELRPLAPSCRFVVDLTGVEIPLALFELLPERMARQERMIFLGEREGRIVIAVAGAQNQALAPRLSSIFNREFELVQTTEDQLLDALDRHFGNGFIDETWSGDLDGGLADFPVLRTITMLIGWSIQKWATEFRMEPAADDVKMYSRIDGRDVEEVPVPRVTLDHFVSGLRRLAALKDGELTSEQRLEFVLTIRGEQHRLHACITPTEHGPRVSVFL